MRRLVKYIIKTDYDNLEDSLKKVEYGAKVGLIVSYNDMKYEFILNMKENSDEVTCFGSSITVPEKIKALSFGPTSANLDKSIVYYKDPTYCDDFTKSNGGKNAGTYNDYFLENIKNMIVQIVDFFGIAHENILFYGSGMGIFKSLMLGSMVENSRVLADSPQLNLLNRHAFGDGIFDVIYNYYSPEELLNVNDWNCDVSEEVKQKHFDRMKAEYIILCEDERFSDDFFNKLPDEYKMIFDSALESDAYTEFNLRLENKLLVHRNDDLKAKVDRELHKNGQIRKECYDANNRIKDLKKENIKMVLLNMQLDDKINKLS